jgi:preprotein translocase SecE subunit
MGSRQRYVVVGILLLGLLAGISLAHGLGWTWVQLGWDDMPMFGMRELPLTRVIATVLGLAAIIFALKHQQTYQLATEVVDELSKVSWPTREETGNATIVVVVTVLLCSVYLGLFDAFWLWVTNWMLNVPGATPS